MSQLIGEFKNMVLSRFFYRLINVNRYTKEKRALLSYSVLHFRKGAKRYIHPNSIESRVLLESLTIAGYSVDVYNNTYKGNINFSKYSLVIGEGFPLYTFLKTRRKISCRMLYYSSGSHPFFQTRQSVLRLVEFKQKRSSLPLSSLRVVPNEWGIAASLSDAIIIVGNSDTERTFVENGCRNVRCIEPPFFSLSDIRVSYNQEKKTKFLWFGSYGFLHKGLDTVIEYFLDNPELELYVCGYSEKEMDFLNCFSSELVDANNIHIEGFVDVRSEKFKELMQICGSAILLSASEGCSTALLTVVGNGGLIPIATRTCGIDIEPFGFVVEDASLKALDEAISCFLASDVKSLEEKANIGFSYVNETFTEANFRNKILRFINEETSNVKN